MCWRCPKCMSIKRLSSLTVEKEPHAANSVLLKFVCRTLSVHPSSHGAPEGSLKDAALELKDGIIGEDTFQAQKWSPS